MEGVSSLCFWKEGLPLLLHGLQNSTNYYYQDDLIQQEITRNRANQQVIEEIHYQYDAQRKLRRQQKLSAEKKPEVIDFFYNSQGKLQEKRGQLHSSRYHYNDAGELVLQQQYQQDSLVLSLHHSYQQGLLVRCEEVRPNGQCQKLHLYRHDEQGMLQEYTLTSGKKIVLEHLGYLYPVLYHQDWLERVVFRLLRRHAQIERVPIRQERRTLCQALAAGALT